MHICPRCGKQLSTLQALNYHLQKKVKCNSTTICKSKYNVDLYTLLTADHQFDSTVIVCDTLFQILKLSNISDDEFVSSNSTYLYSYIKNKETFFRNIAQKEKEFYAVFQNNVCCLLHMYIHRNVYYIKKIRWK